MTKAERDGGLCPLCKVGKMRPAGPPFTDSAAKAGELRELKIVYACNECSYSETRSPEPADGDEIC